MPWSPGPQLAQGGQASLFSGSRLWARAPTALIPGLALPPGEMTKSLPGTSTQRLHLDGLEPCVRACLKVGAFVKLLSWRPVRPSDLSAPCPLPWPLC